MPNCLFFFSHLVSPYKNSCLLSVPVHVANEIVSGKRGGGDKNACSRSSFGHHCLYFVLFFSFGSISNKTNCRMHLAMPSILSVDSASNHEQDKGIK